MGVLLTEGGGATSRNLVGSEQGLIKNGAAWGGSPHGGGLLLRQASSQYVDLGNTFNVGTRSLTAVVLAWTDHTDSGLIGKSRAGSTINRWTILIDSASGGFIGIFHSATAGTKTTAAVAGLSDGRLHQFGGVFDRAGNLTTYADGKPQQAVDISAGAADDMQSAFTTLIGDYQDSAGTGPNASYYVNGGVELALIYGRALQRAEMAALNAQPYAMFAAPIWRRAFAPAAAEVAGIGSRPPRDDRNWSTLWRQAGRQSWGTGKLDKVA